MTLDELIETVDRVLLLDGATVQFPVELVKEIRLGLGYAKQCDIEQQQGTRVARPQSDLSVDQYKTTSCY